MQLKGQELYDLLAEIDVQAEPQFDFPQNPGLARVATDVAHNVAATEHLGNLEQTSGLIDPELSLLPPDFNILDDHPELRTQLENDHQDAVETSQRAERFKTYNLAKMTHEQLMQLAQEHNSKEGASVDFVGNSLSGLVCRPPATAQQRKIQTFTIADLAKETDYSKAWQATQRGAKSSADRPTSLQSRDEADFEDADLHKAKRVKRDSSTGGKVTPNPATAVPPKAIPSMYRKVPQEQKEFNLLLSGFLRREVDLPMLSPAANKHIDLKLLFIQVMARGGYNAVCSGNMWPDVTEALHQPTKCWDLVRLVYHGYLLAVEQAMDSDFQAVSVTEWLQHKVGLMRELITDADREAEAITEAIKKVAERAAHTRAKLPTAVDVDNAVNEAKKALPQFEEQHGSTEDLARSAVVLARCMAADPHTQAVPAEPGSEKETLEFVLRSYRHLTRGPPGGLYPDPAPTLKARFRAALKKAFPSAVLKKKQLAKPGVGPAPSGLNKKAALAQKHNLKAHRAPSAHAGVKIQAPGARSPGGLAAKKKKRQGVGFITPKCMNCKTCLNPAMKKACEVNRARISQGLLPILPAAKT